MASAQSVQSNNRFRIRSFLLQIFFVLSLFVSVCVDAASIYLTPAQAQVATGETVKIKVMVNTQGVAINTVGGVVRFDSSGLEIVSINKLNSILNIWIEEPFFSNPNGTVSFNGGVTTPGYTGGAGEVFSFTVKAKKVGVNTLHFDDVVILKNDGVGTDALSSEGSATITVGQTVPVKQPVADEPVKKAVAFLSSPILTSASHPDQKLWYTAREARVSWEKKSGIGIQTVFDSKPDTKATGQIQYGIGQKMLQGIRDGVSYLHVRYVGSGVVSETAHFAIHVDTTAPTDVVATTTPYQNGQQFLNIAAADITSGLDYAEVSLDDSVIATKVGLENDLFVYTVPADIQPGDHVANIKVYDKAGNYTEYKHLFSTADRPSFNITAQPVEVEAGTEVYITGSSTAAFTAVTIFIESPDAITQSFVVTTDKVGALATSIKIDSIGIYDIWANVPNIGETNHVQVTAFPTWKSKLIAWMQLHMYACLGVLGVVIILLLIIILRCGRKGSQRALLRKISKLENSASAAYIELRMGVESQIKYLERLAEIRNLTDKEKMLYKKFKDLFE